MRASGMQAAGRLGWLALVLLAAGCGTRFGNVSGTVTQGGKPVAGGTITFYDAAGRAQSDAIRSDGTYTVSKVATGRAKIAVILPMNIPFAGLDGAGAGGGGMPPGAPKGPAPAPKYSDPDKSGLTCDVTTGEQTYNISLD
jgi:hypothetical protein